MIRPESSDPDAWPATMRPSLDAARERLAIADQFPPGVEWCQPRYGSCALLSGHRGPHHGYPEDIQAVVAVALEPLIREREAKAWDEGHRSFCAMPQRYNADHTHPSLNPHVAATHREPRP